MIFICRSSRDLKIVRDELLIIYKTVCSVTSTNYLIPSARFVNFSCNILPILAMHLGKNVSAKNVPFQFSHLITNLFKIMWFHNFAILPSWHFSSHVSTSFRSITPIISARCERLSTSHIIIYTWRVIVCILYRKISERERSKVNTRKNYISKRHEIFARLFHSLTLWLKCICDSKKLLKNAKKLLACVCYI